MIKDQATGIHDYLNSIDELLKSTRSKSCSVCNDSLLASYEPGVGVFGSCPRGCKTSNSLYVDFREVLSGYSRKRNYESE